MLLQHQLAFVARSNNVHGILTLQQLMPQPWPKGSRAAVDLGPEAKCEAVKLHEIREL